MTKDVLLRIKGLQSVEAEEETVEMIAPGIYFERDGKHYIKYDEAVEGTEETIQNLIKVDGSSMEVTKRGVTNAHMVFEKNKKNLTYYQTPYGQMLVGVNTKNMEVKVTDKKIDVSLDYELDVNHEPMADCTIKMNIMSRTAGDFSLNLS